MLLKIRAHTLCLAPWTALPASPALQGVALTTALRQVGSQFLYTWLFGSLAAFYFVRSRHLVAAVLPHAFCNLVGPPVVPARHQRAVAGTMLVGAVAFFCLLRPLTEPRLFANGHSM